MLLDVQGRIADVIELHDCAAKNGGGGRFRSTQNSGGRS